MKLTRTKALLESLKSIPDYRVDTGKIEYPLHEVLFMTLFALIKGNTTFKDIFSWMIYNKDNAILKEIFDKEEITIPSKSTYHRLLINTDNNALEKVFREFFFHSLHKKILLLTGSG
ncbi:transposase family protein [Sulfurimonas sediminis]|uniref:Transposase family protein n=1 Tax=Sulfurimonas sediminis TaxID=2590020 RepID=A0A7M1B2V8_9BACT|nr:transposase family protein [Sulfurimonas sediminis]QOP44087.1 transposase family protein [Sulfurimonas sediminis]